MIDCRALGLPGMRAYAALSAGAETQREMIAAGVASASVARALAELCAVGIASILRQGTPATAGHTAVTSQYALVVGALPAHICRSLAIASKAQARVMLALHASQVEACSAKVVSQLAGVAYDSARDAIAQCRARGWIESDRFRLVHPERPEKHDSALKNTTAVCFPAPSKGSQHPIFDHSDSASAFDSVKTELKTVNSKEKQTSVVNFSLYQKPVYKKLVANGVSKNIAAKLIAQDENECEIQIARLTKLKNINNPTGFLVAAILNKYRDAIVESKNKTKESPDINKSDAAAHARDYRPEHEKLARAAGVPTISESERAWQQARDANPGANPKQLFKYVEKILSEHAA